MAVRIPGAPTRPRRRPIVPLPLKREVSEQPVYRPAPPPPRPAPIPDSETSRVSRHEQREYNRAGWNMIEAFRARRLELSAREEATAAQKQFNQLAEEAEKEKQEEQLRGLAESMRPETPSVTYLQAAAFRGKRPLPELMEEASDAEAQANLAKFSDWWRKASPEEQISLRGVSMGLAKESMVASDYKRIVDAARRGDYSAPREDREKANRVLQTQMADIPGLSPNQLGPPTEAAQTLGRSVPTLLPEDEEDEDEGHGAAFDFVAGLTRSIPKGGPFTEAGREEIVRGAGEAREEFAEAPLATRPKETLIGAAKAPITPVLPQETYDALERVPVIGPSLRRSIESLTTPLGAGAAAVAGPASVIAGELGAVGTGTALREAGAPGWAQMVGETVGGLAPAGLVTRPGRTLIRTAAERARARARPRPEAVEDTVTLYHGTAKADVTPHEGMFLTPNREDAEIYAKAAKNLGEGDSPRVVAVRVARDAVIEDPDYIKPGGAFKLTRPESATIDMPRAGAELPPTTPLKTAAPARPEIPEGDDLVGLRREVDELTRAKAAGEKVAKQLAVAKRKLARVEAAEALRPVGRALGEEAGGGKLPGGRPPDDLPPDIQPGQSPQDYARTLRAGGWSDPTITDALRKAERPAEAATAVPTTPDEITAAI